MSTLCLCSARYNLIRKCLTSEFVDKIGGDFHLIEDNGFYIHQPAKFSGAKRAPGISKVLL